MLPRGFDTVQAILTLGMMALAIGIEAVMVVRRWRGLDDHSRPPWSPQQIATARHWRVALAILLTAGWVYMGIALIEGALTPGIAAVLPKALGPLPLPAWLALALSSRGLFYLLWATATWSNTALERRGGSSRPFKPVFGFVCLLVLLSVLANATRLWG
jgi:hypothetical protein